MNFNVAPCSSTSSSSPSTSSNETPDSPTNFVSEFGEISSEEFRASYISFGEPVFSSNIVVNLPNCWEPSVMESSQNFQSINYPVFKKYGYVVGGKYHSMAKKGATKVRHNSLWRRGTPRLTTIKEEPEQEDQPKTKKKENEKVKVDDCNNHV